MRILFVTSPEKTIFYPLVPLAWALRTAGHEVRVATRPDHCDFITATGLTAVPVGRNTVLPKSPNHDAEMESVRVGLFAPFDAVYDGDHASYQRMLHGYIDVVDDGFHPENFPMIHGLVKFAQSWKPDLIVWEPLALAAPIAAKACGAAHARMLFGVDVFGGTRERFLRLMAEERGAATKDPLGDWLAGYAQKYGADYSEDMTTGHFTIDNLPPSLQIETGLEVLRTQFVAYGGAAVVPKWLWAAPERPRVTLTLGTTATDSFAGYTQDIQAILSSLGDLDIELVATIAEAEQRRLTHVPENTRVETFVPLQALAPTCAASINHAGFGTLSTFAMNAVPQLTLPYHFDEPIFAQRYADQGAGLAIPHEEVTTAAIRDGVLRLLEEDRFTEQAAALRDEMMAMPSPNDLVPQLEELTATFRSRR